MRTVLVILSLLFISGEVYSEESKHKILKESDFISVEPLSKEEEQLERFEKSEVANSEKKVAGSLIEISEERAMGEVGNKKGITPYDFGEGYEELLLKQKALWNKHEKEFNDIKALGILIEPRESILGQRPDDLKKHVYVKLKAKLPSLTIYDDYMKPDRSGLLPYIYVNYIFIPNATYLTLRLNRNMFLPDKKTSITSSVWEKGVLLTGHMTYTRFAETLDQMLDDFAYEFLQSKEKEIVDKEINKRIHDAVMKEYKNKKTR